jgi:transposase
MVRVSACVAFPRYVVAIVRLRDIVRAYQGILEACIAHGPIGPVGHSRAVPAILDAIRKRWPWVKHPFADGAYDRLKLMDKAAYLDFIVEIVRRSDDHRGFEVLPRRWVVERTFGWMTRWRASAADPKRRRTAGR